ncbi:MAG TPA: FecR domain-containing protein, partial [Candidatus Krumholzibacteria bacterium]|nr:FecR domain-containing protein [Candidatus Krumholzibacteria bacterium]
VDETPVSLADRDALQRALHPGATVVLPDSASIDLLSDRVVLMEVTAGTEVRLPRAPGRWFHRKSTCTLIAGELRIKTGEQFHGATMRVYTPEGLAEITGTMLSVQCDNGGTCVCVLEGTVQVGVDDADLKAVEPGYRRVMLRDGTKEIIPIKDMHRDGVLDFDRRVGDRIQRP